MRSYLPRPAGRALILVPLIGAVTAVSIAGVRILTTGPLSITDASATTSCAVDYQVSNQWTDGFTATIAVTNLGGPVTSWNLQYSYAGNQLLTDGWDGHWTQRDGSKHVTVTDESGNGRLATDGSAQVGANFSATGSDTTPLSFELNDTPCGHDATVPMAAANVAPPAFTGTKSATVKSPATSAPGTAPQSGAAPQLAVSGHELINSSGQQVVLHGVDRSGTEYECVQGRGIFAGPSDQASVSAMKSVGVNAVRVPLNEACWNGESYVNAADAGASYQSAIKNYVSLLNQNGMVAILDLHWTDGAYTGGSAGCSSAQAVCQKPMPDSAQSVPFWTSVAQTFKGNDAVIFDLFNEPYPERADHGHETEGWQCWRNGGDCAGISYPVAGMQTLVNAVRGTGASNVIMLGGLDYANDLTQWLTYEPADPDHNLVASLHSYSFNSCDSQSCWTSQLAPVIAKVPLIAGEIGENGCADSYIDPLMSWLDSEQSGYLGWAWNTGPGCSADIALITSYDGAPTAYGAGFESHLESLADIRPSG